MEKNYFLHMSAKEAYKGYVRAYASHSMKTVYDVNTLDLQKVAISFGFKAAPFVDVGVAHSKTFSKKRKSTSGFQSEKSAKKAKIYKHKTDAR
jgi:ATP-dependent RNA helicase DDX18/HAS1